MATPGQWSGCCGSGSRCTGTTCIQEHQSWRRHAASGKHPPSHGPPCPAWYCCTRGTRWWPWLKAVVTSTQAATCPHSLQLEYSVHSQGAPLRRGMLMEMGIKKAFLQGNLHILPWLKVDWENCLLFITVLQLNLNHQIQNHFLLCCHHFFHSHCLVLLPFQRGLPPPRTKC